ncbi:MAG TPA: vanadium-dependent haloperoxidase [Candidatus Binatia bacterium]|jgi:membrane-associated phospholipid phosphatase|nr:vanadium-dependent haloperoxidase [Candidatus Binatia bacterium]
MTDLNRRRFLANAAGGVAAAILLPNARAEHGIVSHAAAPMDVDGRSAQAYLLRRQVAKSHQGGCAPAFPTNGDEERFPNRIGSYSKCLPHDDLGLVEPRAYTAYVQAVSGGQSAAMEAIALGGRVKLANPMAAHAFELEGGDPQQYEMVAPPAFASDEIAAEMIELYWQALTRDVPFVAYGEHPLTVAAARDLSRCTAFRGPKARDAVTSGTLFRGSTPGDLTGPYVSQFLWLDVPHGHMRLVQRGRVPVPGDDYMTTYPEWLSIQRGAQPPRINVIDPVPRHVRNARDLGEYVHLDWSYQAYLDACVTLLVMGAPLKADYPYFRRRSRTQGGFITFGAPHVLDCVARVANAALKATWSQKWLVHRRVRPEEFGGHVHNHLTRAARYPIPADLLDSPALDVVDRTTGSFLLPMAYPEGCPTHPSYPSGHAAIAGACTTVLKAFFNETWVIPDPVVVNTDGSGLVPWKGAPLTVGGEVNKLAANISLARNGAGVHWRSDFVEGLKLGEAVATDILRDVRRTCPETFNGFAFTRFDGETTRT